jgi:hypothetical protein
MTICIAGLALWVLLAIYSYRILRCRVRHDSFGLYTVSDRRVNLLMSTFMWWLVIPLIWFTYDSKPASW